MTDEPMPAGAPDQWRNGLLAASYVPLTDVSAPLAPRVLTALERARIAAYLAEIPDTDGGLRLYVASGERSDARTIVAAVVRATDAEAALENAGDRPDAAPVDDPLAGIDTDAAFAALVADWHVDTHTAIRKAEQDLSREDEDWQLRLNTQPAAQPAEPEWLDEDHYVPPNPPPVPRPSRVMALGMVLVAAAVLLFAFGDLLVPGQVSFFLGVCCVLAATALFVMRLREHRDEDDDGAVV